MIHSTNTSNTTHCKQHTDPNFYLYSAILLYSSLIFCVLRWVKWFRIRHELSSLPLTVSTALVSSISLRAVWCTLRYAYWDDMDYLDPDFMYTLNRIPLLLQLSAFSAISLSWIKNAMSASGWYSCFRRAIIGTNFLLYALSFVALMFEAFGTDISVVHHDDVYHIFTLLVIACCCLALALLFLIFGVRLRVKLYGSIHVSSRILRSFNRIFYATCLCSVSFALRAIIFIATTFLYNILGICLKINYWVYPLVVYAVPSCVTAIAILFIMDVDNAEVTEEDQVVSRNHYGAVDER